MTFIDSNVLIDIFDSDPRWRDWSNARVEERTVDRDGIVSPIVVAELSPGYETLDEVLELLASLSIRIVPFKEDAAFLSGKVFARYRRERIAGSGSRVLPDFMIGAHASVLGLPLLTRDPRVYRRYFPELTLITPETDNG